MEMFLFFKHLIKGTKKSVDKNIWIFHISSLTFLCTCCLDPTPCEVLFQLNGVGLGQNLKKKKWCSWKCLVVKLLKEDCLHKWKKLCWVIYLAPGHFNGGVLIFSLTWDEQGSPSFLFVQLLRRDAERWGVLWIAKAIERNQGDCSSANNGF